MKLIYALLFYCYSMFFCYEYAFRSGVDIEKYNSYRSEQKVKNCVEIIANGR